MKTNNSLHDFFCFIVPPSDLELEVQRLARECARLDTRCKVLTEANADHERNTAALVAKLGEQLQEQVYKENIPLPCMRLISSFL
jgi:hypothetical protein